MGWSLQHACGECLQELQRATPPSNASPPSFNVRRGAYWSGTRAALQPLFHSTGLAAYHRITAAAADELEVDLGAAADAGEPVDMAAAMCNLALKVPGLPRCAPCGVCPVCEPTL